jgi:predicted nucleic acid-binding protein
MRIFLDANILFSAAKTDGAVRRLLDLLIEARHECCADGYVVEEARRNLAAKGPTSLSSLEAVLSRIQVGSPQALANAVEAALELPEKDRPVLAGAVRLECEVLITGDRTHFGDFYGSKLAGVMIYSPRGAAEALLGESDSETTS